MISFVMRGMPLQAKRISSCLGTTAVNLNGDGTLRGAFPNRGSAP